jgi:hypothetical protein
MNTFEDTTRIEKELLARYKNGETIESMYNSFVSKNTKQTLAQDLADFCMTNIVYRSPIGEIFFEATFENGSPISTLFVKFPDGVAVEVANLQEAFDALEL